MARNYVDSVSFVKCFLAVHKQGGTIQEVADRLGMQKASATVKASQLRQAGVALPKLGQTRKKLNLGALAKMVSDYEAELTVDFDGKENSTISDHLGDLDDDIPDDDGDLDEDVQDDNGDEDEEVPGRGLVNAAF